MDKTFEDIIMEVAGDETDTTEQTNLQTDVDEEIDTNSEVDLDDVDNETEIDDNAEDESNDPEDLEKDEEDNQAPSMSEKDVQAFIALRQENKKNKDVINYFDNRAKAMGLSGIDELLEKSKESELKQQSEKQGVPVDVLKKINELEERVNQSEAEKQAALIQRENDRMSRTFDTFVQTNNLDKKAIDNLAKEMVNDGIDLETLKGLPEASINKILSAYIPKESIKQQELAKKEQIKKEVPVDSTNSSSSNETSEIDKIAKLWANRY